MPLGSLLVALTCWNLKLCKGLCDTHTHTTEALLHALGQPAGGAYLLELETLQRFVTHTHITHTHITHTH